MHLTSLTLALKIGKVMRKSPHLQKSEKVMPAPYVFSNPSLDWSGLTHQEIYEIVCESHQKWMDIKKFHHVNGGNVEGNEGVFTRISRVATLMDDYLDYLDSGDKNIIVKAITIGAPVFVLGYLANIKNLFILQESYGNGESSLIDIFDIDVAIDSIISMFEYTHIAGYASIKKSLEEYEDAYAKNNEIALHDLVFYYTNS